MSENTSTFDSDYSVRLATLAKLGGDTTKQYDSVYSIDLAILDATGEGGGGGLKPVIVDELPETGEEGKMYFVPNTDPGVLDNYKEYIWVNDAWECVGNANVDLSEYAKVVNLTQAEYDALETKDENTLYNITDATPFVIDDYYTKTETVSALSTVYNPYNTTTANTNGQVIPKWNARGQINGTGYTVYQASQSINGTSRTLYSTSSTSLTSFYAPTTAGTKGYVLTSSGSGAPTWTEYKSDATAYIAEADIEAGTYSDEISAFYKDAIKAAHIGPVQIYSTTEHEETEAGDAYSTTWPATDELFCVEAGETATLMFDQSYNEIPATTGADTNYYITINADGTITDESGTGNVVADTTSITGYFVYKVLVGVQTVTAGTIYTVTTNTYTSESYYLPSSSRLYEGNVELWFFTTEDGANWKNEHVLITDSAVTVDYTSGRFGVQSATITNMVSLTQAEYDALETKDASTFYIING